MAPASLVGANLYWHFVARHCGRFIPLPPSRLPSQLRIQHREIVMPDTNRRAFIGALALTAGGLAATESRAAPADGHAAGYDVAPSSNYVPLIPRKSG